jgi:2'-5' RNA ligase
VSEPAARQPPEAADAGRPATLRLFVAVELSDEWRACVGRLTAALRRQAPEGYRWVSPELLHLTVLFLGSHSASLLPEIEAALASAAAGRAPFRLRLGGLGGFGKGPPRVLSVGVIDPSGALAGLRSRLEAEFDARGVGYDPKPLVPHITLARARTGAGRRGPVTPPKVTRFAVVREPLTVGHLALVESRLRPEGPRYTVLATAALASAGQTPGDSGSGHPG